MAAAPADDTLNRIRRRISKPSVILYRCVACSNTFAEEDLCPSCRKCEFCCDCGFMDLLIKSRLAYKASHCPRCQRFVIQDLCKTCGQCRFCCKTHGCSSVSDTLATDDEVELEVEICPICGHGYEVEDFCNCNSGNCKYCCKCSVPK